MARLDYYLMITMAISLLWGLFVLILGLVFRFSLGQLIGTYVSDVRNDVNLESAVNKAGQNICPVETDISNDIRLGGWAIELGSMILLSGSLIVIFSAIGFIAGLKHNNPLLMVVIILIITACGFEYYLLQIATDENITFHEDAKESLLGLVKTDYKIEGEGDMFTSAFNAVMLTGKCCGIKSVKDFSNMTFVDKSKNEEVYIFMGCYTVVFSYIGNNFGTVIMLGIVSLAVWEMLQLVLAVLLIFTPPPPPPKVVKKASKASVELAKEAVDATKPKPKKFVPYSKVSSFQCPDVNRIKSTEIW